MKNSKRFVLCALTFLLLPFGLSDSPMVSYALMPAAYVPTASYSLVDDSDAGFAVVEVALTNTTNNLIAITDVMFGAKSVVESIGYSSDEYVNSTAFWVGFPSLNKNIFLAPHSECLTKRTLVYKTGESSDIDKEVQTYEAIKNGGPVLSAFAGTVYAATTFEYGTDYFYSGLSVLTTYDADNDKTYISTDRTSFSAPSISYDETFYGFTFGGVAYQTPYYSAEDDCNIPWIRGLHAASEFTDLSLCLYKKGNTLYTTNNKVNYPNIGEGIINFFMQTLTIVFVVTSIAMLIGFIVLLVWLIKRNKRNKKQAQ